MVDLTSLRLENVTEGGLEARFQELLYRAMENLQNANRFQQQPLGTITQTIKLDVVITHKMGERGEPGITEITAGGEMKDPKRRLQSQAAYTKTGSFAVELREATQTDLLDPENQHGQQGRA